MALVHRDFVEETTTTTGTGTLSLGGATTGHLTFVSAIGDGNTCVYAIRASDGNYESGVGTVTDATPDTISRDTLLRSSTGSKLDLPAGTHTVYCTFSEDGASKAYSAVLKAAGGSTDNAIARWDGTDGDTLQNSGVTINDNNSLTLAGDIVMTEKAANTETIAAGSGYLWTKSSTPSLGIFTNDADVDIPVGSTDQFLFGLDLTNRVSPVTAGEKFASDVPFSFVLTRVYASAKTGAGTQAVTISVEDEGSEVLSAVLSLGVGANNAETSTFSGSASSYALTKGDLFSVDIDQADDGTAREIYIYFYGYPTQ